jgi:hypothetical protein
MPFFNDASSTETSIRSRLKQSYDNFEFLLCDDGSVDHASEAGGAVRHLDGAGEEDFGPAILEAYLASIRPRT